MRLLNMSLQADEGIVISNRVVTMLMAALTGLGGFTVGNTWDQHGARQLDNIETALNRRSMQIEQIDSRTLAILQSQNELTKRVQELERLNSKPRNSACPRILGVQGGGTPER